LEPHLQENAVLLALPAGGVPVGYEVAKQLGLTLDLAIVRKIQIPWNTEAGFGAVAWDGSVVLNEALVKELTLTPRQIEESISLAKLIMSERVRKFRGDRSFPDIRGKAVALIDDGLASGYTMLAAIDSVRKKKPRKLVVAVPTGSTGAIQLVSSRADLVICLNVRSGPIFAVADAYEHWYDLTDEEVLQYLKAPT